VGGGGEKKKNWVPNGAPNSNFEGTGRNPPNPGRLISFFVCGKKTVVVGKKKKKNPGWATVNKKSGGDGLDFGGDKIFCARFFQGSPDRGLAKTPQVECEIQGGEIPLRPGNSFFARGRGGKKTAAQQKRVSKKTPEIFRARFPNPGTNMGHEFFSLQKENLLIFPQGFLTREVWIKKRLGEFRIVFLGTFPPKNTQKKKKKKTGE